jgi:hypothetical protein
MERIIWHFGGQEVIAREIGSEAFEAKASRCKSSFGQFAF